MRVAEPAGNAPRYVRVLKTEEKGSDVNLATHLLHDAHMDRYDTAVLISNDSDLVEPIRIVREQLGKRVGILNPQRYPSRELIQHADFVKQIRAGVLAASQFSDELHDRKGILQRPAKWK